MRALRPLPMAIPAGSPCHVPAGEEFPYSIMGGGFAAGHPLPGLRPRRAADAELRPVDGVVLARMRPVAFSRGGARGRGSWMLKPSGHLTGASAERLPGW